MSKILEIPVLERMLQPVSDCLNEEAARRLVRLKADPQVQASVDLLAEKCNEGLLTPDERAEYDSYLAAARLVNILKAKARLLLAKNAK